MAELDELERDLLKAADIWFEAALHRKLQRLVEIARLGQSARVWLECAPVELADAQIPFDE